MYWSGIYRGNQPLFLLEYENGRIRGYYEGKGTLLIAISQGTQLSGFWEETESPFNYGDFTMDLIDEKDKKYEFKYTFTKPIELQGQGGTYEFTKTDEKGFDFFEQKYAEAKKKLPPKDPKRISD